jgi:guanine deaminase
MPRTIYSGPFVHCTSLGNLDICEAGAIGVDDEGVISFVERDVKFEDLDAVVKKHGWDDSKVVRIYDSGFYFPGFIGMSLLPDRFRLILFMMKYIICPYES